VRDGAGNIFGKTALSSRYMTLIKLSIPRFLVALAILGVTLPSTASATGAVRRVSLGRSATALPATDEARLHYASSNSTEPRLFEEGTAGGTIPGSLHAECHLGATFTASVTIYADGGTIKARGTATPHNSSLYTSFAGALTIVGGTGSYAHARGHA